jgi:hypothetical protein
LPEALSIQLMAAEAEIPGCRVQLVRKSAELAGEGPVLMWGDSRPGQEWLRRMHLRDHDALGDVDLPSLFSNPAPGEAVRGPMVLVCTHGKRDRCCAKFGFDMFKALVASGEVDVWQTTHLGGHRFAPTVLELPRGLCYGRLAPQEAVPLARAAVDGRVFQLDRFRGRTAFSRAVQVAEHAARARCGEMEAARMELLAHAVESDGITATFSGPQGPISVRVEVETGPMRPASCHRDPTPTARFESTIVAGGA